jgi:hypothetical protein
MYMRVCPLNSSIEVLIIIYWELLTVAIRIVHSSLSHRGVFHDEFRQLHTLRVCAVFFFQSVL